jgi:hypothetical protein
VPFTIPGTVIGLAVPIALSVTPLGRGPTVPMFIGVNEPPLIDGAPEIKL